jgi:precorrin-6B methylase 2
MPARLDLKLLTTPGAPVRSGRRAELYAVPPLAEADDFDRLLDGEAQRVSRIHWTPAVVCRRAAELLALKPGERVLDVGSGVGKLCLLASQHSDGRFVGVEQRLGLVTQSRSLAARLGSSAEFLHGEAFDLDWTAFRALYFYNPFDEARFPSSSQIDGSIKTGPEIFNRLVAAAQARLEEMPSGTRVVTFHGIGGPMPECFELQVSERAGDGQLQRWVRR